MGNYSKEEIRAFKLKDIMNCRMSALKAAATNNEGKGKKAETLKKEADIYYEWLRQDQKDVGGTVDTSLGSEPAGTTLGQLPEPTLAQKKVLDAIAAKFGKVQADPQLKSHILAWAKEVYGQQSYPTKVESVETFLKWFNN